MVEIGNWNLELTAKLKGSHILDNMFVVAYFLGTNSTDFDLDRPYTYSKPKRTYLMLTDIKLNAKASSVQLMSVQTNSD